MLHGGAYFHSRWVAVEDYASSLFSKLVDEVCELPEFTRSAVNASGEVACQGFGGFPQIFY